MGVTAITNYYREGGNYYTDVVTVVGGYRKEAPRILLL